MKKSWKIFIFISILLLTGLQIFDSIKNSSDKIDESTLNPIYMGSYQLDDKEIMFYRSPLYTDGQGYYYLVDDVKHSITVNRQLVDTSDESKRFFVVPNKDYIIRCEGVEIEPNEIIEHEQGTLNIYLLDKSKQYTMRNGNIDYDLLITFYIGDSGSINTSENDIDLYRLETMISNWKTSTDYTSINLNDHSKRVLEIWNKEHKYDMLVDGLYTDNYDIYTLEVNNSYYVQIYKNSNAQEVYNLSKDEWNEFNDYVNEMIEICKKS